MGGIEGNTRNPIAILSVSRNCHFYSFVEALTLLSFRQLAFAGQYLHPVADAIASQMQAAVSICIIGPVADRNGEVEV